MFASTELLWSLSLMATELQYSQQQWLWCQKRNSSRMSSSRLFSIVAVDISKSSSGCCSCIDDFYFYYYSYFYDYYSFFQPIAYTKLCFFLRRGSPCILPRPCPFASCNVGQISGGSNNRQANLSHRCACSLACSVAVSFGFSPIVRIPLSLNSAVTHRRHHAAWQSKHIADRLHTWQCSPASIGGDIKCNASSNLSSSIGGHSELFRIFIGIEAFSTKHHSFLFCACSACCCHPFSFSSSIVALAEPGASPWPWRIKTFTEMLLLLLWLLLCGTKMFTEMLLLLLR